MADPVREYGWGVIYASNKEDIVCTVAGEINIPGVSMTMDEDPLIKGGPGLYYVEGVYGILVNGNKLSILHNGYNPYWDYYYSGSYWDSYWWGRYWADSSALLFRHRPHPELPDLTLTLKKSIAKTGLTKTEANLLPIFSV